MKKGEIQLTVKDAQAEIDALTAQLAEARAQFVLLDNEQAAANAKADRVIAELETQLGEARAQIAAKDKRIAELEGLLREGMVMIKNADALRAAVNVLAADVLEVRS